MRQLFLLLRPHAGSLQSMRGMSTTVDRVPSQPGRWRDAPGQQAVVPLRGMHFRDLRVCFMDAVRFNDARQALQLRRALEQAHDGRQCV